MASVTAKHLSSVQISRLIVRYIKRSVKGICNLPFQLPKPTKGICRTGQCIYKTPANVLPRC